MVSVLAHMVKNHHLVLHQVWLLVQVLVLVVLNLYPEVPEVPEVSVDHHLNHQASHQEVLLD